MPDTPEFMRWAPDSAAKPGTGYIETDRAKLAKLTAVNYVGQPAELSSKVDLSGRMTKVKSQMNLRACVGFAMCAAMETVPSGVLLEQDESDAFVWYNAKARDDTGEDPLINRGTSIGAAVSAVMDLGSCWELDHDYAKALTKPSDLAYLRAKSMRVHRVAQVEHININSLRGMLSEGWPIVIGFNLFGDYDYLVGSYATTTGIMTMPTAQQLSVGRTDGHAVVLVGYDDGNKLLKFKNSWSDRRGDKGYYYMPYDYVQHITEACVITEQDFALPAAVPEPLINQQGVGAKPVSMLRTSMGDPKSPRITFVERQQPNELFPGKES